MVYLSKNITNYSPNIISLLKRLISDYNKLYLIIDLAPKYNLLPYLKEFLLDYMILNNFSQEYIIDYFKDMKYLYAVLIKLDRLSDIKIYFRDDIVEFTNCLLKNKIDNLKLDISYYDYLLMFAKNISDTTKGSYYKNLAYKFIPNTNLYHYNSKGIQYKDTYHVNNYFKYKNYISTFYPDNIITPDLEIIHMDAVYNISMENLAQLLKNYPLNYVYKIYTNITDTTSKLEFLREYFDNIFDTLLFTLHNEIQDLTE
jgi:hypothetical protein